MEDDDFKKDIGRMTRPGGGVVKRVPSFPDESSEPPSGERHFGIHECCGRKPTPLGVGS